MENLLFLLDGKFEYEVSTFLSEEDWKILYQPGHHVQKALGITRGFLRRAALVLFGSLRYDYIFIHREAAPIGPPVFEYILARVLRKKYIFDFDDAIWIPNTSAQNKIASRLKCFWKIRPICRWAHRVSAGNDFLVSYAEHSGRKTPATRIPTVVNTATRYNRIKQHQEGRVVVGWTGSHSTLKFLEPLMPVIQRLQKECDIDFLVIADKKPDLPLSDWQFCPWNEQTEIEDLLKIDVGVMPLVHDAWSEGKCGFKLIQYLSLGIPAVANSVGVNKLIIEDGINGFLADDDERWYLSLKQLITDAALRTRMGESGRAKMVAGYSISSQSEAFLGLFS
ncbi:MAG: glycosyltransferase [Chitinophagaceae bacterium]